MVLHNDNHVSAIARIEGLMVQLTKESAKLADDHAKADLEHRVAMQKMASSITEIMGMFIKRDQEQVKTFSALEMRLKESQMSQQTQNESFQKIFEELRAGIKSLNDTKTESMQKLKEFEDTFHKHSHASSTSGPQIYQGLVKQRISGWGQQGDRYDWNADSYTRMVPSYSDIPKFFQGINCAIL